MGPVVRGGAGLGGVVSPVGQDYLKNIWTAQEWNDAAVTTTALAARLGLALSTVSEQVHRLVETGMIVPAPYRPIELTAQGRVVALRVVRRHRLLETYLVEHLGYGWDQVHEEAEVLEHVVSELFLSRIDDLLGHPVRDPHGDPIPTAQGHYSRPEATVLSECAAGMRGRVVRIADADAEVLRQLQHVGLGLDTRLQVAEAAAVAGGGEEPAGLRVLLEQSGGGSSTAPRQPVTLAAAAAAAVRVVVDSPR